VVIEEAVDGVKERARSSTATMSKPSEAGPGARRPTQCCQSPCATPWFRTSESIRHSRSGSGPRPRREPEERRHPGPASAAESRAASAPGRRAEWSCRRRAIPAGALVPRRSWISGSACPRLIDLADSAGAGKADSTGVRGDGELRSISAVRPRSGRARPRSIPELPISRVRARHGMAVQHLGGGARPGTSSLWARPRIHPRLREIDDDAPRSPRRQRL